LPAFRRAVTKAEQTAGQFFDLMARYARGSTRLLMEEYARAHPHAPQHYRFDDLGLREQ
jgi:hypothetical protein